MFDAARRRLGAMADGGCWILVTGDWMLPRRGVGDTARRRLGLWRTRDAGTVQDFVSTGFLTRAA